MLIQEYKREEDIPENVRGAYVADASGVYVLDELDQSHPTLKKNGELLAENIRYKGLNTKLQNKTAELESKAVPEGHIAIKAELAPIVKQLETLDIAVEDLATLKEENERYKQNEAEAEALGLRQEAAESLDYKPDAFARLAANLQIEKDGEKYFVKDGEDKKELTRDFVASHDNFKPFLSSLEPTPPPGHGNDPKPLPPTPDDVMKTEVEAALSTGKYQL